MDVVARGTRQGWARLIEWRCKLTVCALLGACGGSEASDDTSSSIDSGVQREDAGKRLDASSESPEDAGMDAATPKDAEVVNDAHTAAEAGADAQTDAAALFCEGAPCGVNLLANPGFELGVEEGWSSEGTVAEGKQNPAPYEGANYLYGTTATMAVEQVIDLVALGFSTSEIDAEAFDVVFGGFQAGWETQEDAGQISVFALDAGEVQLTSEALPSFFSNSTWVEQSGSLELPSGARRLLFRFNGVRAEGTNNDAYLDAAYLCLVSRASPADAGAARCAPMQAPDAG